jgi:hypothetical protein
MGVIPVSLLAEKDVRLDFFSVGVKHDGFVAHVVLHVSLMP